MKNTEVILTENRPNGAEWRGVVKPFMLKSIEGNQYSGGFKRYDIDIYDEVEREPSKKEIKEANEFFDKVGGRYAKGSTIKGGGIERENAEMVLNNNKQISHHTKELATAVKGKKVPAWVVAKVNRSASDLSDATHYLDGSKFKNGGGVGNVLPYGVTRRSEEYPYRIMGYRTEKNNKNDDWEIYGDYENKDLAIGVAKKVQNKYNWFTIQVLDGFGEVVYENEIDKMAKGGYVFKGDKYEYVPTKFTYTIGGL
jgi:hypothetical protein